MNAQDKPADYHAGCNPALARPVPSPPRRTLVVGGGGGGPGALLKMLAPAPRVSGAGRGPGGAAVAARPLEGVFQLEVEAPAPPLEPGSLDCIVYGDV